jgi:hypothetical protein
MDVTTPEMWKQEWLAFASAPYIILPFIVAGWLAGLWFRGRTTEGEIAGLKREISVMERRLELAAAQATDQKMKSDRDLEELKKEFEAFKAEVAAKGIHASPAKVDAAIVKVADSSTSIGSMLLELHRSLDQSGARSLDQSLPIGGGYPMPSAIPLRTAIPMPSAIPPNKVYGTTLNSTPDDIRNGE